MENSSTNQQVPTHMSPQKGDITLFENKFLERISRISPLTVLLVYLPVVGFSIWRSFAEGVSVAGFAGLLFGGLLFWTLFEYFFHRYIFHFKAKGDFQERMLFLFHGVHHQYPNDKDRLVMPIAVSLIILVLLYALFKFVLGSYFWPFFAGFTAGYLVYDMMHYSIHHFRRPKNALMKNIWRYHLQHHFKDTHKAYGVSSPLWDYVFGTLQDKGPPKSL